MIFTFPSFKPASREKTYGLTPKKKQEKKESQGSVSPTPGQKGMRNKYRRGPAEKRNKMRRKPSSAGIMPNRFGFALTRAKTMGDTTLAALLSLFRGHTKAALKPFKPI
jgi:hypothetical protein